MPYVVIEGDLSSSCTRVYGLNGKLHNCFMLGEINFENCEKTIT